MQRMKPKAHRRTCSNMDSRKTKETGVSENNIEETRQEETKTAGFGWNSATRLTQDRVIYWDLANTSCSTVYYAIEKRVVVELTFL